MSWILKHRKKLTVFMAGLLMGAFAFYVIGAGKIGVMVWGIVYLSAVMINELVCRKMNRMGKPFAANSSIRNVDYLAIGDCFASDEYVPAGSSMVQICAPNRGYCSAWQILRHTHSILREEGGTVIMAIGNSKKDFLIFDIPFLHRITIEKYHLEGLYKKSKFPLLFSPISSLSFLLGGGTAHYEISQDVPDDLRLFCKERNYRLIYLKKDVV